MLLLLPSLFCSPSISVLKLCIHEELNLMFYITKAFLRCSLKKAFSFFQNLILCRPFPYLLAVVVVILFCLGKKRREAMPVIDLCFGLLTIIVRLNFFCLKEVELFFGPEGPKALG